ncbi:hypothetical protein [Microbacterium testaceum]|uniref:hypothetical protein n=1 Tax=Microbacterium testaceum TaxID=2033 RepID=UPI002AC4ACF8|nr:hypothetical protein [Microbacterium testaceum]MDZ5146330.1 hypothetical protein [Microbacterium testaceum]
MIDYVGSILSSSRGLGMVINCAVTATSDASLERLLLVSIRRFLIDEAKATPVGRLRRRLRTLLAKDSRFVSADRLLAGEEGWTVPENGDAVWDGDVTELTRLTSSVQVATIDRLNTAGPTPAAARHSLVTMSYEAVARAVGAIRAQLLARFLHERFQLDAAGPSANADGSSSTPVLSVDPDDEVAVLARRIYDDLSAEDVTILAAEAAAAESAPTSPRDALFSRLRPYAGSETGRDAVNLVIRWCAFGADAS